jgi:hypothetical protein
MTRLLIDSILIDSNAEQPDPTGKTIHVLSDSKNGEVHLIAAPPYRLVLRCGQYSPTDLKIGTVWDINVSLEPIVSAQRQDSDSGFVHRIIQIEKPSQSPHETSLSEEFVVAPRSDRAGGYRSENIGRPTLLEGGEDKTLRVPVEIIEYMKELTPVNSRALRWMLDAVPEPNDKAIGDLITEVDAPDPDDKRVLMSEAKRTTVYIDTARLRKLEGWGQDNVSRGVRILYAYIEDHPEIAKALKERSVQAANDRRSNNDVLNAYVKALHAYNGEKTAGYEVTYHRGWYQILRPGGVPVGSYRRADIVEMTEQLNKLIDAEPIPTPEE